MITKQKIKYSILAILAGLFVWIIVSYFSAKFLITTNNLEFNDIVQINNRNVENIDFQTIDKYTISSWIIRNDTNRIIILLPGIKGNRLSQISRAEFYLKKGFSVLMPDLRGTGKSKGDFISFGWHERKDLLACVNGLSKLGFTKISVDGQSLGAATIIYSISDYSDYEFIILESCYDNISNAFKNRVTKYSLPYFVFKPVEFFTEQLIGVSKKELVPDELIKKVKCPILILAGDAENQIPIDETMKLYDSCGSNSKNIHIFKGAKHENFHDRFKSEFENVITNFIDSLSITN